MKHRCIIKSIAGFMAIVMSFYGSLPVGAAACDTDLNISSYADMESQGREFSRAEDGAIVIEPDGASELVPETSDPPIEETAPEASTAPVEETIPEPSTDPVVETSPDASTAPSEETLPESSSEPTEESAPKQLRYQNGTIYLYDFDQLKLVGTNAPLLDEITAEPYRNEAGESVSYGLDAQY